MIPNKINIVSIDYVGQGTFMAGEEDCFNAGVDSSEPYVAIKELDFFTMRDAASKYVEDS
jgi:hypothetical protein